MKTQTIKLYENRPDVTLTTYLLADSPELLNGKVRPAVLVCPGGAYLNCSDRGPNRFRATPGTPSM